MDSITNNETAFSNQQLGPEQWPDIHAVTYANVERKYLYLLLIRHGLVGLVMAGAACASWWIDEINKLLWTWMVCGMGGAWCLYLGLMVLSFRKKGYALREHDMLYREGVLVTDITIVPYNRIQHLSLHRGILSRLLGLTTLKVFTAGHDDGDLSIPGLLPDTAERIKAIALQHIQWEATGAIPYHEISEEDGR